MRTDGVFTIHGVSINSKMGQTFTLIPFGDVHRDSPAHAADTWKEFLKYGKTVENPLYLGMGDYTDAFSTSERRIMYSPDLHESTRKREERDSIGRITNFAEEISFMRGKLLGLLGGNHYMQFQDGTTGDQRLAGMLGCPYLGACCALRLTFVTKADHNVSVDVFAHHGKGGGVTAGGRMNSVERLQSVCEADIFLMGDNHARGVLPLGDKLRLIDCGKQLILRHRRAWIGRTGSFLRGYVPGESSYVTDGAMPPASLGWVEFYLTPKRDQSGDRDLLTVDIQSRQ